ncbi:MAG TPA: hypothetical protein IGR64_09150 [Leptolyngbyaceae cyanobacterium M65_K2018_010]|nr:hypothetical protein [Leptolyngbyaceae cyanobacterium M65_K2018_010]
MESAGRVLQINLSAGGVPKRPVAQAHYPGSSRLYARVRQAGFLSQGDPALVLAWGQPLGYPFKA